MLLLADRVDEWVVSNLTEFDGKPLRRWPRAISTWASSRTRRRRRSRRRTRAIQGADRAIGKALGEQVKEVRVTHRLTDSPACLVADQHGMGVNLERMLKAAGQKVPGTKPILEINPQHPLVQRLKYEAEGERFDDWSQRAVRPGAARRGRAARGSGDVREAAQRADAGHGGWTGE